MFGVAAHLQHHFDLAGHGIGHIRAHIQPANGRHHIVWVAAHVGGHVARFANQLRRADQGVTPQIHGRRTRMIRQAMHGDSDSANTHDVGDRPNGQPPTFQNRALLNVQLNERCGATGFPQCLAEAFWSASDAGHRLCQAFTCAVF